MPPTPLSSGWVHRAFVRLQGWADAGWSNSVVLAWGLLQGCVFPGLADLFFLPLAIARPHLAYRLALVATTGTVIGSALLYVVGAQALELLQGPIVARLGVTTARINEYRATLSQYGGWAIFASTMSPLSTKLTSIASGAIGVPWAQFFFALLSGRLLRTFAIAWLVQHGGAAAVARFFHAPASGGSRPVNF